MKTIVLHDYFENADGGGRLSLTLAKGLHADLAYGFKTVGHPFFGRKKILANEFPISHNITIPILRQFLLCRAFINNTTFIKKYNYSIFSGCYSPLAARNSLENCKKIYYCHTPPRFIYDQKDFYFAQVPPGGRLILRWFINYLKPRYEKSIGEMDLIIANSVNIQKRIKKFLGVDSKVIYPPCDIEGFKWCGSGGYYLSTARLDPLKRVDIIVKSFMKMPDKKLIVASGGPELPRLKKLSIGSKNITFTGWLSEKLYRKLVGNAIATLYLPEDEDFGLSPVESMAAGKPVIGIAEGGLLETVTSGLTGNLISPPIDEEKIQLAVGNMTLNRAKAMRRFCEKQAEMFQEEIFIEKIHDSLIYL
ncbi:MAG: glycosyltransferase [Parcubacteria group bacterium]|nr:glycosyltransferase [Parcubacteria group bacterium]